MNHSVRHPVDSSPTSIDDLIDAYKRVVDRTLPKETFALAPQNMSVAVLSHRYESRREVPRRATARGRPRSATKAP